MRLTISIVNNSLNIHNTCLYIITKKVRYLARNFESAFVSLPNLSIYVFTKYLCFAKNGNSSQYSKIMTNAQQYDHCKPLLIKLKVQTVINLYNLKLVSYILNRSKSLILVGECHNFNTINKREISIEHCRSKTQQNCHSITQQFEYL